jgi:hypothetical protein
MAEGILGTAVAVVALLLRPTGRLSGNKLRVQLAFSTVTEFITSLQSAITIMTARRYGHNHEAQPTISTISVSLL